MRHNLSAVFLLLAFFICITAHAQQDWAWGRGNTGGGIDGWSVATDLSGNVFAAGIGGGDMSFGNCQITDTSIYPDNGCVIVKYDAAGNALWAHMAMGGYTSLNGIATDPFGNVYMFGSIYLGTTTHLGRFTITNTAYPMSQSFLAKFDPSGNVAWVKMVGGAPSAPTNSLGTISLAFSCGGIATDEKGNIYIDTWYEGDSTTIESYLLINKDTSGKTSDIIVAKYDSSGNLKWAKDFGSNQNDDAEGITITPSGSIYIAGNFASDSLVFGSSTIHKTISSFALNKNAYIAELDNNGNALWASASNGDGSEFAIGIVADLSGNIYLTGGLKSHPISFSGTTIINLTPDRAVLYLVKFDPTNHVSWYKTIHGASPVAQPNSRGAWGYSIAMSQCGIVWVSGAMDDSLIADGHLIYIPADGIGGDPIFATAYTSSGTYAGSVTLSSGGDDQNSIASDPMGNLYMCSDYFGDTSFSIGPDILPAGLGSEYIYVAKHPYALNSRHSVEPFCLSTEMKLTAPPGYSNYIWSNGQINTVCTVHDTGTIWVYAFDSCSAITTDSFVVHDCNNCGRSFFVPNLFTPNGDGQNDVFYPRAGQDVDLIKSFRVYNRWGELIFNKENIQPNDASNAWDGTYMGMEPRPEVYVWIADIVCETGTTTKKGNVTIIR